MTRSRPDAPWWTARWCCTGAEAAMPPPHAQPAKGALACAVFGVSVEVFQNGTLNTNKRKHLRS